MKAKNSNLKNKLNNNQVDKLKTSGKDIIVSVPIKNIPIYAVLAVFALTTFIFFWNVIFGNSYFWEDIVRLIYPLQNFAAKEAAKGITPFWNPFAFTGMPFIADLQVGFFYPLNRVLGFFWGADGNLSFSALQLMIILHFFIAQINTYFFAKSMKISSIGSIITAVGYSFSLIFICHTFHPMIVQHLSWFPLVLLFFIKAVRYADLKSGILAGIIFGVSMFPGHIQVILYQSSALFIIFLWYSFFNIKEKNLKGKYLAFSIISAALTIIIAVGIFMIQYKPTQEMVQYTKRNDSTYQFATEGSLELKQVFTMFIPKLFGSANGNNEVKVPFYLNNAPIHYYWETSFYFGIGILALGLFGFLANNKRRDAQIFLILSIFAFLFALGKNSFIFDIFYNLPFFGLFRNPGRILFITVLGFSYLAGLGFDAIYQKVWDKDIKKKMYISFGIVLFFALLGALGIYSSIFKTPVEYAATINEYGWLAVLFTVLVMFIVYFAGKFKINSISIGAVLILIIFVDLFAAGGDFNQSDEEPLSKYKSLFENNPNLKSQFTANIPNDPFRVKMRLFDGNGRTIAKPMEDNQGMLDNIFLIEGYNTLILRRHIIPIKTSALNDLKNVRYSLEPDSATNQLNFIKRESAYGPAWFVYKTIVIPTDKLIASSQQLNYSTLDNIDFKNNVVLEKSNKLQLSEKPAAEVKKNVKVVDFQSNYIKYQASSEEDAILCFSEIYYPEWKAYIDGKETEIYAANYGFRAIDFPKGNHTVEMKYESEAYASGKLITIFTLISSIIGYFTLYFFDKKKKNNIKNVEPNNE